MSTFRITLYDHLRDAPMKKYVNSTTFKDFKGSRIIEINGTLDGNDYDQITALLLSAENEEKIKDVKMIINSPGGLTNGNRECADAVVNFSKPIIAASNSMIASAAYKIGIGADKLYVTPSAEVGSIGTVLVHEDISGLLDKIGVKITPIAENPEKWEYHPYKELSKEDEEKIRKEQIRPSYERFRDFVVERRPNVAEEALNSRVFSGTKARSLNMVDGLINNIYAIFR